MSYTLIITEKPSAAKTIANALADGVVERKQEEGAKAVYYRFAMAGKKFVTAPGAKAVYYRFAMAGKKFVTAPAVGHLYTLKAKRGSDYPTFDLEWVPSYSANKFASFTKEYLDNLLSLVSGAKDFIVATDYDTEGEVIAYNILRFVCKREDARRMKFSTMTKEELQESYKKIMKHIDSGQVESGLTRHFLDFYYGVNISKALMSAVKTSGRRFRIMSTGRVQGPSVSYDEDVIIENSSQLKFLKIGEFVDKVIQNANEIKLVGDCEVADVPFICKTYVFNPNTFKTELKPVTQVVRHRINEPLYKVTVESGKTISVTASHSLFALKDGDVKTVETKNLNEGDFLLVPTKLPFISKEIHITDLFKNSSKNIWVDAETKDADFYVILSDFGVKLIRQKRHELKVHANSSLSVWERKKQKARWSIFKNYLNKLKIDENDFLSKGVEKTIPFKFACRVALDEYWSNKEKYRIHGNSRLFMKGIGRGSEWRLFANSIFDENFARLLGYFIAEGSFVGNKALCLDFGPNEMDLANDAVATIEKIFNKKPKIKRKKSSLNLYFGGRIGFALFNAMGVYNKVKKKIIPNVIFNSSENIKLVFLKGLFEGDGYFDRYSGATLSTASKELASAIVYLLVQLGLDSTSIRTKINESALPNQKTKDTKIRILYEIKIQGKRNIEKLIDVIPFRHKKRLLDYLSEKETKTLYGGIPIEALCDITRYYPKIKSWREVVGKGQLNKILTKLKKKGVKLEKLDNLANGDISFLRIKKIEVVEPKVPYVYDLATDGYENFLCGFGGVFAHNTLHMLAKHEKKIKAFKPKPFWQINAAIQIGKQLMDAEYEKDKIWEKDNADKILKKIKGAKTATLKDIAKKLFTQKPPKPYNTTSFLADVYRYFGYSPQQAMSIAEALYQAGLISYPRTSSEKLPPDINYKKIITSLGKQDRYIKDAKFLLAKKELKPEEGKRVDPAHPAIYPTGELPKKMGDLQQKVYDLVVRRFLAVFGDPAKRESQKLSFDINGEIFFIFGKKTVEAGWTTLYGKYAVREEILLPELSIGSDFSVKKIEQMQNETQPPARYSQGSVLKEMEEKNLGTKCLTGDCKVISPDFQDVRLDELWNNSEQFGYEDGVEVRKLNTPTAISLNETVSNIEFKKPQLISRRMIFPGEKLLKIKTRGGELKVTDDHPIYLYDNSKIILDKSRNLSKGDKLFSIISRNKTGKIIADENWFIERKFKIHNKMLVSRFSGNNAAGILLNKLPLRWSSDLAWVLGYFYGDGSYNPPSYNGSHQFYFSTTEKKAVGLLKTRIKRIFGVEPKAYLVKNGRQYKVQCNSAIAMLLADVFPSITKKEIFDIPRDFTGDFLRGFFDADGNVHLRDAGKVKINGKEAMGHAVPRVKITLAKENLIYWIRDILEDLGLHTKVSAGKARLNGKYFNCFTILIGGREIVDRFAWKVGFDVKHKKEILYKGLLSDSLQYKILKTSYDTTIALQKESLDAKTLKNIIGCSSYSMAQALKRLVKLGVIKRKRLSPYSKPANRAIYECIDKDYYFHTLRSVYENIIGEFYAANVEDIEEIDGSDVFVYDISVSPDSPNFITNGAILVHNSTRAGILQTLYNRGYLVNKSIEVTELGMQLSDILEKSVPDIVSEKLTRHFEEECEQVEAGKIKREAVMKEAQQTLIRVCNQFRKKEKSVGEELTKAIIESQEKQSIIGPCPQCGGTLKIHKLWRTGNRFVGCTGYKAGCKFSAPLPRMGNIMRTEKVCEECKTPIIQVSREGARPFRMCVDIRCPTKKEWFDKKKLSVRPKEAKPIVKSAPGKTKQKVKLER
ncbi:MAG: hypothetical protein HZB67_02505 [Candidatus Aenigmarchaeota archaeon]|nr:hypothetical protein [Candidatus Aenigmarchaeota archaeon]